MSDHNRFEEEHRDICQDCRELYMDFLQDQYEEAQLDALAELEIAVVI